MLLVDGFIKHEKILKEIKKDHHWLNTPTYNWWDGWWKIKPRNIWETTIEIIWKNFLPSDHKYCGFEYWATKLTDNGEVKWHHDKDEKLVRKEKKMVCPTVGHIYYAEIANLEGGFLELAPDQNTNKEGKLLDTYTINHHTERYMPLENRLIMFNPSRLHRVSKIHKGTRKAFLANAWTKKPSTFDDGENINVNSDGSFQFVEWKEKNQTFNI
tara:strand:+ start:70 stop:708 length:639 start_codon:yes stop_codon:yes gene_type:complete